MIEIDSRIRRIDIEASHDTMAPKKWALQRGIGESGGEIIMTTDADCIAGPGWIETVISHFFEDVGLVAGFSPLADPASSPLFSRLIGLDALALASVAAGSFGLGLPLTCSGRNLAYRKSVFQEVGGFHRIGRFISGDDDLFLRLVKNRTTWKIRYAVEASAAVTSAPPGSVSRFFQQRLRHASKSRHYGFLFTLGLLAVYVLNVILIVSLFFAPMRPLFLAILSIKSTSEFLLISRCATLWKRRSDLRVFPLAMLIHPLYVVVLGGLGPWSRFRWKGAVYSPRGPSSQSS
jgi:cellulose synthase/poly-beta-1,6-N-acetylglucosamine synthase-like glycosyltransferase